MHSTIVSFLEHGHCHQLQDALSEDVVFHSPVKTYQGQAEVVHILSTIRTVLDALRPQREFTSDGETVTIITAQYGGHRMSGVLIETTDQLGRIEHATLLLRPLSTLLDAIAGMRSALRRSPIARSA